MNVGIQGFKLENVFLSVKKNARNLPNLDTGKRIATVAISKVAPNVLISAASPNHP